MDHVIQDEDSKFYRFIYGPRWPDVCGHGGYVATFEHSVLIRDRTIVVDIYVFDPEGPSLGQAVCLRYGAEGSEYYSPGPIAQFLRTSEANPVYKQAAGLLNVKGEFRWNRKY